MRAQVGYAVVIPLSGREDLHAVPLQGDTLSSEQRRALMGYQSKRFKVIDHDELEFELHVCNDQDKRNHIRADGAINQWATVILCNLDANPQELQHHCCCNVLVTGLDSRLLTWREATQLCRFFIEG